MDSGSSPSVAVVDEAKAKPAASSLSFPSPQIQPPITVMMQQAIAMQQFQFQQALLMQQVMASQQAAARAATVKSAAEMAAARAAEISKQLKGSDAGEENEKTADPSASRSKSRSSSHSRSHSRSRSRSRSHSPIRYRRDRSLSGSPIRYRRDRYSPSRYRDYYGYRSRSRYRGYYRGGRGDYFRSYYRREWERDRDREYLSHRSRRSRSRSRVRRRSKTRSPSPRHRRDQSQSPKRYREDRLAGHRSRYSISREAKRSPSRSRSSSASGESKGARKEGKSLHRGSLLLKSKAGDASDHLDTHSDSMEIEHPSSRKSSRHLRKAARKEKVNDNRHSDISDSPVRSLSVSLEPPLRKTGKMYYDEDVDSTRHTRRLSYDRAIVDIAADDLQPSTKGQCQPKAEYTDASNAGTNGYKKGDTCLSFSNEHQEEPAGWGEMVKKRESIGKLESSDNEMEDEKELDDWRDDIKAYAKEKAMRKESRKEAVKKEDDLMIEDFHSDPKCLKENRFQQHMNNSMDAFIGNGKEPDRISSDGIEASQDIHCEGALDIRGLSDVEHYSHKKRYVAKDVGESAIKHALYSESKFVDLVDKVNRHEFKENAYVNYNSDGGTKGGNSENSDYENKEADLVYEGPVVAANEYVHGQQQFSPLKHVENKEARSVEYKLENFYYTDSTGQYKTSSGKENLGVQSKHIMGMAQADDGHVSHKRKGRERDAAKEEHKRDDDEHEKPKDRHKKHRRKYRHELSTEPDDDNDDNDDSNMDGESHKGKKHHRKKHRKDEEDRRERKKRRHRRRAKAVSSSPSQSLAIDDKDKVEAGVSSSHRKSSIRHKKRHKETSKLQFSSPGSEVLLGVRKMKEQRLSSHGNAATYDLWGGDGKGGDGRVLLFSGILFCR